MRLYDRQPAGVVARARQLRRDATPAEKVLWRGLREAFPTARFRRQAPIAGYFADFLSVSARLVIEVDGDTHADAEDYDTRRTAMIAREGYRVVRFTNAEVLGNLESVLTQISSSLREKEGARDAQRRGKDEVAARMEKGDAA